MVKIPLAQTLNADTSKSNGLASTNELIPLAIAVPNPVQSNSEPNEKAAISAVLSALAIVVPTALNRSSVISPFKKSARPVPKLLAL